MQKVPTNLYVFYYYYYWYHFQFPYQIYLSVVFHLYHFHRFIITIIVDFLIVLLLPFTLIFPIYRLLTGACLNSREESISCPDQSACLGVPGR